MHFHFAAACDFARHSRKKLLLAFVLITLVTAAGYGQTDFTRNQFARFSLLTRARFFEDEIRTASIAEGVDPNVLWTIAYNETRFRPWLTSPKNAQGLMQFIPSTAARFDLINPYSSGAAIRAAARYIKYLSNLFGGRLDSILAAYNSGEGTVLAYLTGRTIKTERKVINPLGLKTIGGVPPYAETIGYVGRGLKLYAWLIRRGTFPVNSARANFPPVISLRVAQVRLVDNELGKIPDFGFAGINPKLNQTQAADTGGTAGQNSVSTDQENSQISSPKEVYYDSRSGSRYVFSNGNQTKLAENGMVVITTNTHPNTTNKARSTFFAAPLK